MPLWQIFHPPGTYQDQAARAAMSKDITASYTSLGMPAFFVVVNFIETKPETIFVGGEPAYSLKKPFIRFVITHIHIKLPDADAAYARTSGRIDKIFKTWARDLGYDWEYHVDETERRLWKINGIAPPESRSEDEKVWVNENRAVPPEEMAAARQKLSNL